VTFSWLFSTLTPKLNEQPATILLFSVETTNATLTLLILDGLLGTLMPIAKIRQELRIQELKKQNRE
jgi:hypothetical protein